MELGPLWALKGPGSLKGLGPGPLKGPLGPNGLPWALMGPPGPS